MSRSSKTLLALGVLVAVTAAFVGGWFAARWRSGGWSIYTMAPALVLRSNARTGETYYLRGTVGTGFYWFPVGVKASPFDDILYEADSAGASSRRK